MSDETSDKVRKRRSLDLTGQVYNDLKVIEQSDDIVKNNRRYKAWLCECECKNKIIVTTRQLRSNEVKNCGCKNPRNKVKPNQYYGRLKTIERCEKIVYAGKLQTAWLCECECGNQIKVATKALIHHHKKSCGCLANDSNKNRELNLKDQRSGRLVAKERLDKKKHGVYVWLCECECGNTIEVRGDMFKSKNVTSCGCYRDELFVKSSLKNCVGKTKIQYVSGTQKDREDNQNGLLGVYIDKRRTSNQYFSKVRFQGKLYYLGYTSTPEEAHRRYIETREKLRQEFQKEHPEYADVIKELKAKWKEKQKKEECKKIKFR